MDGTLSLMSALHAQKQGYTLIEGVIQAGSYNATDGSAQVYMAHTVAAAAFPDSAGSAITPTVVGAKLAVDGYGKQYGAIGGERVLLGQCGAQWIAWLHYASDDSPGAPSGETWTVHRVPTNPTSINAYWKLTNDGATPGDGLGGYKVLAGGQGSIATAGGISVTVDDSAGTATVSCGTGLSLTINKGSRAVNLGGSTTSSMLLSTSGSTSIGMSTTTLTFNGAATTTANGIVRQSDLATLVMELQTALDSWASTNLQAGSGATGPAFSGIIPTASAVSYTL